MAVILLHLVGVSFLTYSEAKHMKARLGDRGLMFILREWSLNWCGIVPFSSSSILVTLVAHIRPGHSCGKSHEPLA